MKLTELEWRSCAERIMDKQMPMQMRLVAALKQMLHISEGDTQDPAFDDIRELLAEATS